MNQICPRYDDMADADRLSNASWRTRGSRKGQQRSGELVTTVEASTKAAEKNLAKLEEDVLSTRL